MEEAFTQCQGPDCTNKVKQASTECGHRARLYCGKNCRMAACRARQRAAEEEAERQRLIALERAEREALRTRFGNLLPGSIDLLYQLKKDHWHSLVEHVGQALQAERATPVPPVEKSLMEANIISWGHKLNFPAICEQGIDIPDGLSGWWHYCHHTSVEVLELFFTIVRRLILEKQTASKVSA
jgi:hypothetical protein